MTTPDRLPAEAFPVGEYLRDELDARGWSVAEFAAILGRPAQAVSEILNSRKEITVETAMEIAAATGTDAATWLRLQDTYRLWRLAQDPRSARLDDVARRRRLRELVPLNELVKRGVIPAGDLDEQERAVRDLLGIETLDQEPSVRLAARRSDDGQPLSPAQLAWFGCVQRAARDLPTHPFDPDRLESLAAQLSRWLTDPARVADLPRLLAPTGVRIVYVLHLKSSKIDGAAYEDERGPVVGVSGRIPGLDSMLFTVLHELAHVARGDVHAGASIDSDIAGYEGNGQEHAANELAGRWALPSEPILPSRISGAAVRAEAARLGVHPAIVVGRLHHSGRLPWRQLNGLIPNIRHHLETWHQIASN